MNKERNAIESNALIFINGNIKASELNQKAKKYQQDILVEGNIELNEDIFVSNKLYVLGNIGNNTKPLISTYKIQANNGLYCDGKIVASKIKVSEYLYCSEVKCISLDVAGDVFVKKDGEILAYNKINIIGDLSGSGVIYSENEDIKVYENIDFNGRISFLGKSNLYAKSIISKELQILHAEAIKIGC